MLNGFYKYIVKQIVSFFQNKANSLHQGERFCLRLDTMQLVTEIDQTLQEYLKSMKICGTYDYGDVYSTYTLILDEDINIVIAAKTKGMTDDFLATLRNAELTEKKFPILMITDSPNDSILSGTVDLSSVGMPFHPQTLSNSIKTSIEQQRLPIVDQIIITSELDRKEKDQYADKYSLYEYRDVLSVLDRGYIVDGDYSSFLLFIDHDITTTDKRKIADRIENNRKHFYRIDNVVKHGNLVDDLSNEYDDSLLRKINDNKKNKPNWYDGITFTEILESADKVHKHHENPLFIDNTDITAYYQLPINSFEPNKYLLVRNEGETKAKQRIKNILLYNPEAKDIVTFQIQTNITLRQSSIETSNGVGLTVSGKKAYIEVPSIDCNYARVKIHDHNNDNVHYELRICIVCVSCGFLDAIRTSFSVYYHQNLQKSCLNANGITDSFTINPDADQMLPAQIVNNGEQYTCNYNQQLPLIIDENSIDTDNGYSVISIHSGKVAVQLKIFDNKARLEEITGSKVFLMKNQLGQSFEFVNADNPRLIIGTKEFYVKQTSKFSFFLKLENEIVRNGYYALKKGRNGEYEKYDVVLPSSIQERYADLIEYLQKQKTLPSLVYYNDEYYSLASNYVNAFLDAVKTIYPGKTLTIEENNLLLLGCIFEEDTIHLSPLHPLNVQYQLAISKERFDSMKEQLIGKLTALFLLPYIKSPSRNLYKAVDQSHSPEWCEYTKVATKNKHGVRRFVPKLVADKIEHYKKHFPFLFEEIGNKTIIINLINMGDCEEVLLGIVRYIISCNSIGECLQFKVNIYDSDEAKNAFHVLESQRKIRQFIRNNFKDVQDENELIIVVTRSISFYFRDAASSQFEYAHLAFYEMPIAEAHGTSYMDSISTGVSLGGLVSGVPSVLSANWYKTGFGAEYLQKTPLTELAKLYNSLYLVAHTGSSYEPKACMYTEVANNQEQLLNKIYSSSNWVVFIEPKVDLTFFQRTSNSQNELMIIHYSDQYSSASGYDDITVTQRSQQYQHIIYDQLIKKGVSVNNHDISQIISLFNAINGSWLLKLISTDKLQGALDSNFSREKMSILSAIKLCMAYYAHQSIIWIPISLEEMLRVSGGVGLSQSDGLLSAKNLGFSQRPTCDDILLVGINIDKQPITIYLHPVEVKIGENEANVIKKAHDQVLQTYTGLWNALWPDEGRDLLEYKLTRNFFIQSVIVSCEKLQLYKIYPEIQWDIILNKYRRELLNEEYVFSKDIDQYIGKGTVISFKTGALLESYNNSCDDEVVELIFPEKMGSEYMIKSTSWIEHHLRQEKMDLPQRLQLTLAQTSDDGTCVNVSTEASVSQEIEKQPDHLVPDPNIIDTYDAKKDPPVAIVNVGNSGTNEPTPVDVIEEHETSIQITFGTDLASGQKVIWYPNDTSQVFHTNTGIIGTMGTGKTQFTKSMIAQLVQQQNNNVDGKPLGILIFDYKGDYNESKKDFVENTHAQVIKPYHLPFNPLAITRSNVFKPLLPIHTANAFKDTLSKIYQLGPKQQNSLFTCILEAYKENGIEPANPQTWDNDAPTFNMVYDIYMANEEIKKNDSLAAAMDKLYQFQIFEGSPSNTKALFDLLNGVVVIDLSGYDADIQSLIVAITLDLFYSQMQAAGSSKINGQYRQLTKLILVDEADNFMSEGFPALKKILKEGREFGVGTILSTQFLKHFGSGDDDYSKYILTWVVHNVSDLRTSDVEFVFKTEAKGAETQKLYNHIKQLQKHHSIVKIGTHPLCYIEDLPFWKLIQEVNV